MRATRVVIHLENLKRNIETIQSRINGGAEICVPVKADAYGHGAPVIAKKALEYGAARLATATADEAIELRECGVTAPILLLSTPRPQELPAIIENGLTPLVYDREFITALENCAETLKRSVNVHLKIDTGMGRIGCPYSQAAELAAFIASQKTLRLEGVCTHFAVSDSFNKDDSAYTEAQIDRFDSAIKAIKNIGVDPGIIHAANSGAIIAYPQARYSMVRPGVLVYGYAPSVECRTKINVRPVMELRTEITSIRPARAGTCVSYGREWTAKEDTVIGVIPVGYADGLPRRLSPGLRVTVGGAQYPVVGRICMDQCMIDLGADSKVRRWDQAIVFGPQEGCQTAYDLADALGTIPYEITCAISKRVPRLYNENGKEARI